MFPAEHPPPAGEPPAGESGFVPCLTVIEVADPRPPLGHSIAYAELGEVARDGQLRSVNGSEVLGRLALGQLDDNLRLALIGVLNSLGRAARGDPRPSLPETDELALRDLPGIICRTTAARALQGRLRSFPDLLKAATPYVIATPLLAAVSVVTFAVMVASGVSLFNFDAHVALIWGANFGPSVVLDREYWRLLTSAFVHYGVIHVAANVWCLLLFGPLVERLFGTLSFAALYLMAGLGGAIASLWYHPMLVSAGASGAIFGIVGALLGYLVARRDVSPRSILKLFRPGLIAYLVIDSLLGLAVPSIDSAAHLGGLTTGFVCGLVLHRPWPPPPLASGRRRLAAGCAVMFALALLYASAAPGIRARVERDPTVIAYQSASKLYNTFSREIAPGEGEFDDISREMNLVVDRMNKMSVPTETLGKDLKRLISRGVANEDRLKVIAIEAPDLLAARNHLASAQHHYVQALQSLTEALAQNEERFIQGPDGYFARLAAGNEDLDSYKTRHQAYMKAHDLTPEAP